MEQYSTNNLNIIITQNQILNDILDKIKEFILSSFPDTDVQSHQGTMESIEFQKVLAPTSFDITEPSNDDNVNDWNISTNIYKNSRSEPINPYQEGGADGEANILLMLKAITHMKKIISLEKESVIKDKLDAFDHQKHKNSIKIYNAFFRTLVYFIQHLLEKVLLLGTYTVDDIVAFRKYLETLSQLRLQIISGTFDDVSKSKDNNDVAEMLLQYINYFREHLDEDMKQFINSQKTNPSNLDVEKLKTILNNLNQKPTIEELLRYKRFFEQLHSIKDAAENLNSVKTKIGAAQFSTLVSKKSTINDLSLSTLKNEPGETSSEFVDWIIGRLQSLIKPLDNDKIDKKEILRIRNLEKQTNDLYYSMVDIFEDLSGAVRVYLRTKDIIQGVPTSQTTAGVDQENGIIKNYASRTIEFRGDFTDKFGPFYNIIRTGMKNKDIIDSGLINVNNFIAMFDASNGINPVNVVLFTYGMSGSGKTYTLFNPEQGDNQGIMRIIQERFQSSGLSATFGGYKQVYGYLVDKQFKTESIPQIQFTDFETFYKKLVDVRILPESGQQVRALVDSFIKATPNNPQSSRGFLLGWFDIKRNSDGKNLGRLGFVDMAGNEDPYDLLIKMYPTLKWPSNKDPNNILTVNSNLIKFSDIDIVSQLIQVQVHLVVRRVLESLGKVYVQINQADEGSLVKTLQAIRKDFLTNIFYASNNRCNGMTTPSTDKPLFILNQRTDSARESFAKQRAMDNCFTFKPVFLNANNNVNSIIKTLDDEVLENLNTMNQKIEYQLYLSLKQLVKETKMNEETRRKKIDIFAKKNTSPKQTPPLPYLQSVLSKKFPNFNLSQFVLKDLKLEGPKDPEDGQDYFVEHERQKMLECTSFINILLINETEDNVTIKLEMSMFEAISTKFITYFAVKERLIQIFNNDLKKLFGMTLDNNILKITDLPTIFQSYNNHLLDIFNFIHTLGNVTKTPEEIKDICDYICYSLINEPKGQNTNMSMILLNYCSLSKYLVQVASQLHNFIKETKSKFSTVPQLTKNENDDIYKSQYDKNELEPIYGKDLQLNYSFNLNQTVTMGDIGQIKYIFDGVIKPGNKKFIELITNVKTDIGTFMSDYFGSALREVVIDGHSYLFKQDYLLRVIQEGFFINQANAELIEFLQQRKQGVNDIIDKKTNECPINIEALAFEEYNKFKNYRKQGCPYYTDLVPTLKEIFETDPNHKTKYIMLCNIRREKELKYRIGAIDTLKLVKDLKST